MTKRICVHPVAAPTLCIADKKKGQSKYTLCTGKWVEAELGRYKMMPWLHLNIIASCYHMEEHMQNRVITHIFPHHHF